MFVVGAGVPGRCSSGVESRAAEPIIPLDLFKNRIFTLSVITVMLVGLGMFGAIINLPLFIQGVQGDARPTAATRSCR